MTASAPHPDLLCIGAQKAGTTWLDQVLRSQPGFHLPPIKELHYFSERHDPAVAAYAAAHRRRQARDVEAWHARLPPEQARLHSRRLALALRAAAGPPGDGWYRSFFAPALPGQCRVDICPSYWALPAAGIDHALALNPALKVLVLVRDPVERAWSHLRMLLDIGHVTLPPDRLRPDTLGRLWRALIRYSDYRTTVTAWLARLGPDRLRLVDFARIAAAPEALLAEIAAWAGAPAPQPSQALSARVFPGPEMAMPAPVRAALLADLEAQYAFLADCLADGLADGLADSLADAPWSPARHLQRLRDP